MIRCQVRSIRSTAEWDTYDGRWVRVFPNTGGRDTVSTPCLKGRSVSLRFARSAGHSSKT